MEVKRTHSGRPRDDLPFEPLQPDGPVVRDDGDGALEVRDVDVAGVGMHRDRLRARNFQTQIHGYEVIPEIPSKGVVPETFARRTERWRRILGYDLKLIHALLHDDRNDLRVHVGAPSPRHNLNRIAVVAFDPNRAAHRQDPDRFVRGDRPTPAPFAFRGTPRAGFRRADSEDESH